jgi:hypothetical protein
MPHDTEAMHEIGKLMFADIRRHRERQQHQMSPPPMPSPPVIPPPRLRDENGLMQWHRN